MSRNYVATESATTGLGIETPAGGLVSLSPQIGPIAPSQIAVTPSGATLGPLQVAVADVQTDGDAPPVTRIDTLEFAPDDSTDGSLSGLLFGTGLAASVDENHTLTRRQYLAAAGVVLAATLPSTVDAASPDLPLVRAEIGRMDAPTAIGTTHAVDGVLPSGTSYHVDVEGTRQADTEIGETATVLPAGTTGEIQVYADDLRASHDQILAWVRGITSRATPLTYTYHLPQKASSYDESELVPLTRHPAVIDAVSWETGSEATVTVGNSTIPHAQEQFGHDAGSYHIDDSGAFVYRAGSTSPASKTITITARGGFGSETSDTVNRLKQS